MGMLFPVFARRVRVLSGTGVDGILLQPSAADQGPARQARGLGELCRDYLGIVPLQYTNLIDPDSMNWNLTSTFAPLRTGR